jgi:hypothetical protein
LDDAKLNLEGTRDEAQSYILLLALRSRDGSGANNNAWGCVSYAVLANRACTRSNLLDLLILLQQPVHVMRKSMLDRRGRCYRNGEFNKYSIKH